jgi:hypothetical protein
LVTGWSTQCLLDTLWAGEVEGITREVPQGWPLLIAGEWTSYKTALMVGEPHTRLLWWWVNFIQDCFDGGWTSYKTALIVDELLLL